MVRRSCSPLRRRRAPAKKVLTVDDYARWRSIADQQISGDGKWVAYGLSLANTAPAEAKPVLHILNLETNQDVEVANATGGTFSPDSRWMTPTRSIRAAAGAARGARGRGGTPAGGRREPRHTRRHARRSEPGCRHRSADASATR